MENPLFRFVFVPPLAQQPAVPKTSIKEQFPQSLGLKRRRVVYRASRDHFPPPLSPGRGGLPKSTPPAHLWNRVRAVALKPPLQVVTRKPGSCVSSHTRRNQVSVTLHTQTPPPAITGPGPGPCVPHRCPTTGTSVAPLVPLARSLGAWLGSAQSAPYETASALGLWPNPEVGVEMRHLPGSDYTGLPQDLQAVVRSLVPSGRSAPGAGIQACCGIHRCLIHRLGSHVQRARSIRGLDGSPTALAYQLPRVASSTPCPEPSQRAPSAQGRSGPYGQHCDRCVYQPARRFALPSHVATRPPPPPLESEASEVPSCHPHPRSVQSGSRRAVPSSTSRRVETPSPGGSADLGTVRSCPGRPVCISRNHPLPRVLHPNRGNARHGCTGTQLAPGPAQICVPPSEPTSTDTVQDQGGRGAGLVSGSILAQQDLVPGTHAPRDSPSLANSSEEGSAFSETGHPMAPVPGPVETPRMVPGWDAEVLADLPQEVALTITSARAPSIL